MKNILIITISLVTCVAYAQKPGRYLEELFTSFDTLKNIQYGHAVNIKGEDEKLFLDLYQPHADRLRNRPLVIFVHGGGYTGGDKATGYPMTFTEGLSKRGYVVASINYRLGLEEPKSDTSFFEAMFRVMQDAKASVRFLRMYAGKYGIDENKIYIMGGSAGAHAVLHLAYMDESELPPYYNKTKLGTLEGNAGNDGVSSKVAAVINCWGAIIDMGWIKKGDIPFFGIHGAKDVAVPVDSSDLTHGFKYGSRALYHHTQTLGIYSGMKIYEQAGHTLDNDVMKQKEALNEACTWLYELVKK
ncbi:MAG: alpha/beta hydrolase [Saprospiraceae bacterium]